MVDKLYDNLSDDRRAETMTVANGVGIGMGGEKAHAQWLAHQDIDMQPSNPAAASQAATIGRLRALYSQQGSVPLRNAIRRLN